MGDYVTSSLDLSGTGLQFIIGEMFIPTWLGNARNYGKITHTEVQYSKKNQAVDVSVVSPGTFLVNSLIFTMAYGYDWLNETRAATLEVQILKDGNYPSSCNMMGHLSFLYTGKRNVTKTGKTCQKWTSQTPHRHSINDINYPFALDLGDHNYCRSPNKDFNGAWCLTMDEETRWEYCSCEYLPDQE